MLARVFAVALLLVPAAALADSLVATRLIRPTDIIAPGDVTAGPETLPGAATDPDAVVGLEARVAIYPGRPVRRADLGPAAVVERNARVQMIYRQAGLTILSEGRALGRAALGEAVTVMNLSSRQSVQGTVASFGIVEVASPDAVR